MKQVLSVSTAVLAFAFLFAFYYYLTLGEQTVQLNTMATTSKATVGQQCDCTNLSFLNGYLFATPSVKPPLRATDWPLVVQRHYTDVDAHKSYVDVSQKATTSDAMALNAEKMQVQNK